MPKSRGSATPTASLTINFLIEKETMSSELEIICPECLNISQSGNLKRKKCFYNVSLDCWHCFQCDAKGKGNPEEKDEDAPSPIPTFDLPGAQEALRHSERAIDYLKERFGWIEDPFLFGLGYDSERDAIVIPNFDHEGTLQGIKYRMLNEASNLRYLSEPGSRSGLYVLRGVDEAKLLLCEGEFDAMAAYLMGFDGLIAALQTNRAGGGGRARLAEWLRVPLQKVYVCADDDDAGLKLLEAPQSLGIDPLIVTVVRDHDRRFKDLSERLEKLGIEAASKSFAALLESSKSPCEASTFTVFERLEQTLNYLQDKRNTIGISTGYKKLDEKLGGGLLPYTLTALSAPGKTGKTTFLIALIHNLIKSQHPVGFISLEMNPTTHVIPSLLSIATQSNVRRKSETDIGLICNSVTKEKAYLNNLSFFDRYGTTSAEEISEWIKFQYIQKNVCLFFLDHVGYSLKDIKDSNEHSKLSKSLRALTREYPIHIFAIVQPKQLAFGQKQVTKHDLYGSVTWSQDLNQLLTLEKTGELQVSLRLTDSHNPLARPSDEPILLFYDPETCQLSD